MTRCLLSLSPLSSADRFAAALRRYFLPVMCAPLLSDNPSLFGLVGFFAPFGGVPSSLGHCGRFSHIFASGAFLCRIVFGVSSRFSGCRGCSGPTSPLAFSASCARLSGAP